MTPMQITQAELEVARFLAGRPTPAEILAFRLPEEIASHFYELVDAEREGPISDDERAELDTYVYVEHMVRLIKAEAGRLLGQQAS